MNLSRSGTLIYHPLLSNTATTAARVPSFILLTPIAIFQSHSWYAWSCLPQSSRHWSEIKEQPSVRLHNSCTAKKQRALKQGRVRYGCWSGCCYGRWQAPECVQLATNRHMVYLAEQSQTGLVSALSFQEQPGLGVAHPLLLLPCFESEDACCFHFLPVTWEPVVYYRSAYTCTLPTVVVVRPLRSQGAACTKLFNDTAILFIHGLLCWIHKRR